MNSGLCLKSTPSLRNCRPISKTFSIPPTSEPLEVQLGGDPEIEIHVVGVDVGLERPGVRTAVDQLQDGGLDLGEAACVQGVADAAHDRRARVGDVARIRADDEVDVALAGPGPRDR